MRQQTTHSDELVIQLLFFGNYIVRKAKNNYRGSCI